MTGYGRATATAGGRSATAEIRSVNHRFLDVRVRLPHELLSLEDRVRRFVTEKLERGRVEINITLDDGGESARTVTVDERLLQDVRTALERVQTMLGSNETISLSHVLHIPDLWRIQPEPVDEDELMHTVGAAVVLALEDVVNMRRAEGAALAADIGPRIDTIEALTKSVADRAPLIAAGAQQRLTERLQQLLGENPVDPDRVAQEAAILADRADVSEELARIGSHLGQLRSHVERGGSVGRTLDFLLQELNREWNTIASKTNDATAAHMVVAARAELEKIREQVQNIQ